MNSDNKCFGKHFSIEETEDGYALHVKGDKEKLKAKLEALEAYHNFRQKAKAAGFGHHLGRHLCKGMFSMIHKHVHNVHGSCRQHGENKTS